MRNAKLEHTVNYRAAQASMRIIELENRCTGNRTAAHMKWNKSTKTCSKGS
jgi:hypothetical protein